MARTFKARFSKGVIKPLEKVDFKEGKEITVTIIDFPVKTKEEAFARSAGKWKGTIDAGIKGTQPLSHGTTSLNGQKRHNVDSRLSSSPQDFSGEHSGMTANFRIQPTQNKYRIT